MNSNKANAKQSKLGKPTFKVKATSFAAKITVPK